MSREPTSQSRALTLTEELEKLEQSITLTLQEIDHNFSRAHRIVTSSILPVVEEYTAHSRDVWEGSKFFESSANVSLSGYEEQPSQDEHTDVTATDESTATVSRTDLETSESYETPSAQHISTSSIQDLDLSNLSVSPSHSTPRAPTTQSSRPATFADYPSPYETLRQEINNTSLNVSNVSSSIPPETPEKATFALNDIAASQSSPFLPPQPTSIPRPSTVRKKTDPLLHRVLDRNYRVQATPTASNRFTGTTSRVGATPATTKQTRTLDMDAIMSSSPIAPPELHPEIFTSPERKPRVPGVSVLTPSRNRAQTLQSPSRTAGIWDSDDDDLDEDFPYDQSPPKTMQFHVPQNRLLKTPAKEASKKIMDDILATAGVDYDEEIDFTQGLESPGFDMDENSPSVYEYTTL
ncbi:hypothetical protein B0A52_08406 [Exophiala mesophila]|uniref:DASH complex subunit ASK1 n=1 Tax=Exophiala mesophila TaxID=212818 RepID=A0A438MW75_EXOME|nr:hypothetical protein B0A52_08406 [Exophiala mesophila]